MKFCLLSFLMVILAAACPVSADISNCQGVFVGRIWVEKGEGLKAVVFLNSKLDSSVSYWSYFNDWSSQEKKDALAMLMTAKASGHRINLTTENSDGCGINGGGTTLKSIYLTTNP